MKTTLWLNQDIIPNGLICDELYKLWGMRSKKQIFEVCCGAKGIDFLPLMRAKGHPLEYEVIKEEFGRYINGQHKPEFKKEGADHGYTSAIYCQYEEDKVYVDTTATCFLDCHLDVYVEPNHFAKIIADQNCHLRIHCPESARAVVEHWGDVRTVEIIEGKEHVRLKDMRNGE